MNIKQLSSLIALLKTNKIVRLEDWDMQDYNYQIDLTLDNFTTFSLPVISFNVNSKTDMLMDYNNQIGANKLLCQDYLIETLMSCERLYFACNAVHSSESWFNEAALCFVIKEQHDE